MRRHCSIAKALRNPRLVLTASVAFIVLLACKLLPVPYYFRADPSYYLTQDGFYLLISPTCRIVNLDPWNDDARRYYVKREYYACATSAVLTEVVLAENDVDVFVQPNHELAPADVPNLSCCVANVTRVRTPSAPHTFDDNQVLLSDCEKFDHFPHQVSNEHPTFIRCINIATNDVYENIHQPIALIPSVRRKLSRNPTPPATIANNSKRKLSVVVLGIDSISRLNFFRTMPHTFSFLQSARSDWLEYKIYQKMGDNTMPNLMAILTGFNHTQSMQICQPLVKGGLDGCPFIWQRFSERGYVTIYAEDLAKISTFNYGEKVGFNATPADYYMRPYHLAAAHFLPSTIIDEMPFCSGLVQDGERVFKVARDFARLHKTNPHFGFFWMNSFSHEDVNAPGRMDDKVRDYLFEITDILSENSLIIFLSDHGMRFGPIRNTLTGYLEERLPFLFLKFPKWYQMTYPKEYAILQKNTERMVTPYDLYMTLQKVLTLGDEDYNVENSLGCPACRPLMEVVPLERSCADANITEHWCTCSNLREINTSDSRIQEAADVAVARLNALIGEQGGEELCARFQLDRILKAFTATNHYGGNDDLVVVEFQTAPRAQFEVSMHTGNMEVYGGFSRLDSYKASSACTNHLGLQMFCYCKALGEFYVGKN